MPRKYRKSILSFYFSQKIWDCGQNSTHNFIRLFFKKDYTDGQNIITGRHTSFHYLPKNSWADHGQVDLFQPFNPGQKKNNLNFKNNCKRADHGWEDFFQLFNRGQRDNFM
jgi:hypothetical protein